MVLLSHLGCIGIRDDEAATAADGFRVKQEKMPPKGAFKVADLEMFLGTGTVKQTDLTSATKAFPVANLQTVTVRASGGVVLSGTF